MRAGDTRRLRQRLKLAWACHQATLVATALVLLAAVLRLWNIDAQSCNNDEVFGIWLAGHNLSYMVQYTTLGGQDMTTPPLYYLLLHAFLAFGDQPILVRLPSVIAGVLMVWLTFQLAMDLFDLRVATLSALFVAVAPLQITFSQVGRGYILGSLCALSSLYFFARIFFNEPRRRDWAGLVVATALALWTFYTTILVALYENACMALLWLRRRTSRSMLIKWFASQLILGFLVLVSLLSALAEVPGANNRWISRPGPGELVKSAILFSTGDPSYGPTGITPARILSLITFAGLGALGVSLFLRRGYQRRLDEEGRRVLFVFCAFVVPWATIFAISQVRPLYVEKYFLFAMPPLFILLAWILARVRPVIISSVVLLGLLCLTGSALFVYYTEPAGEQWREAIAYMRAAYQSDDLIVISPGHYGRPFAYYFQGSFPPDLAILAYAPALVVENGKFRALNISREAEAATVDDPAFAVAQRVWLVSGYAPVDPAVLLWAEQDFDTLRTGKFVGASARLLERTRNGAVHMTEIQKR